MASPYAVYIHDKLIKSRSYFKFLRISIFIMVLIAIHSWLENSLAAILITHLTGDGLKLPKAAAIVNVQDGVSAFLLLLVVYLTNTKIRSFGTVIFTAIFYLIGLLVIFFMARKEKVNIAFLFVAVIFIALGRSGRDISLRQFLAHQCKKEWSLSDTEEIKRQLKEEKESHRQRLNGEEETEIRRERINESRGERVLSDEEKIESRRESLNDSRADIYWRIATVAGVIISLGVSVAYKDMELAEQCKMSAIAIGVALVFFLAGTPFYHYTKSDAQSVALQLLLAARKKKHLDYDVSFASAAPSRSRHIYMDTTLRWVDKAAIVEPSPSMQEQILRGTLYTIDQVREVKRLISMIPMWMSFLVYGLLQATASVFFYEQVDYMDQRIGRISNLPIVFFVVIIQFTGFIVSYICEKLFKYYCAEATPRHVMLIRIGAGLAITPICCLVSWRVENHRLEKYVKSDISINVAWLFPQFVLLGVVEGLVVEGMEDIFNANVSVAFRKYGPAFTEFAPNIGHFISLALVLNLRSLFGDNLDTSSLGTYYAILAYICFVNFMFYCFIATHFVKRHQGEELAQDEETPTEEIIGALPIEDLVKEGIQNVEDNVNPYQGNEEKIE